MKACLNTAAFFQSVFTRCCQERVTERGRVNVEAIFAPDLAHSVIRGQNILQESDGIPLELLQFKKGMERNCYLDFALSDKKFW